jgi:hypothetical protein
MPEGVMWGRFSDIAFSIAATHRPRRVSDLQQM